MKWENLSPNKLYSWNLESCVCIRPQWVCSVELGHVDSQMLLQIQNITPVFGRLNVGVVGSGAERLYLQPEGSSCLHPHALPNAAVLANYKSFWNLPFNSLCMLPLHSIIRTDCLQLHCHANDFFLILIGSYDLQYFGLQQDSAATLTSFWTVFFFSSCFSCLMQ